MMDDRLLGLCVPPPKCVLGTNRNIPHRKRRLVSMNGFQLTEEGKTHVDCETDLNENYSALSFSERSI